MHANVPQFIDIEDKIAFNLTGKQLLWLMALGALLLVVYNFVSRELFYAIAFFAFLFFGALAFWKPQGVSLIAFFGFILQFIFRPKNYVWRRVYSQEKLKRERAMRATHEPAANPASKKKKPMTREQLKKIAWILDTQK